MLESGNRAYGAYYQNPSEFSASFPFEQTLFATVCFSQYCGSGSGKIDIILADLDRMVSISSFPPNVKLKY